MHGGKWYRLDHRGLSNLLIVCAGVLLYLALTHFAQVKAVLDTFLEVCSPFIVGFVIAYLLNTPTNFFERKVYAEFKYRKGLSILTVYLLAFVIIGILLNLILPQVVESLMQLVGNMSQYLRNLDAIVHELARRFGGGEDGLDNILSTYNNLMEQATAFIAAAVPDLLNFGVAIGNGVITAITAVIASIYMLFGRARLIRQLKKLIFAVFPAKGSSRILRVCSQANQVFVGFINGKLIDSAIIGVLCFFLTVIFQIPYAVLISVIVGTTNVIPFFGPFIGAIPSIMLLFIIDPWAALRFAVIIVALQQFDGNILGPKILGDSTGLSAIWVLISIVVGGGLFGFTGMLLGVPTFAVLYSLFREWVNKRLAEKNIDENGEPLPPKPPTESD